MKKIVIIAICLFTSFVVALFSKGNPFLIDVKVLIPVLLTLLGLCFTAYTFIHTPILNVINKNKENKVLLIEKQKKLLNSLEEDMLLIFYSAILIVVINLTDYLDIPLIIDPTKINFGLFTIISVKESIVNFFVSLFSMISFYAFYDIIKATFKIFRSYFD